PQHHAALYARECGATARGLQELAPTRPQKTAQRSTLGSFCYPVATKERDMGIDRRRFVQTVGGAGMFAALGQTGAAQQGAGDFEQPAGLRPGAQLDSRFPVSFAKPVSEGLRLVMEYFTALSQRDLE